MYFYIGLFGITTVAAFCELLNIKKAKKLYIFIALLLIYILFSATRWNNPDWDVYYPFFMKNNELDDFLYGTIPVDKGFGILNYLVKILFDDFTALLSILAIIIITIKGWFIKKYSSLPLLSVLLWFGTYIGDMFCNRQTLAISITLLAFYFIIKKQIIPFVLVVIIAASIQVSVIAFILAYPIYHSKLSGKCLIAGVFLSVIIGAYLDNSYLIQIASMVNLIDVDTERLLLKIDTYVQETADPNSIFSYARRLLFIPLEIYMISKMEVVDKNYRGCVNLIVCGYMMYFLLINVSNTFATRISSSFYIYEILVLPNIIGYYKRLDVRILCFILLGVYACVKYVYAIELYQEAYIPYTNVLFGGFE